MTILLTGFEPFGVHKANPSRDIVEAVAAAWDEPQELITRVLPVDYEAAGKTILDLIAQHDPDIVLMLGLADSAPRPRLERVALNLDDALIADNTGVTRRGTLIRDGAPLALKTTLDLSALEEQLSALGHAVDISNHAGAYICNHIYFEALLHFETAGLATPCLFVHVPPHPADPAKAKQQLRNLVHMTEALIKQKQTEETTMPEAPQFSGAIPENYEEGLVPVIFIPYADDLTARAVKLKPDTVLELAAGTGVVTRALHNALPASTSITATDLSDGMLSVARSKAADAKNVSFEVVDAMSIPKGEDTYDLLVAQFGVMFVPDKVASYREALRVLKPGGTYMFNAWDSWEGNPWAGVAHKTVEAFFPGEAPGFYKVPFHYHDPDEIKRDLEAAGFTDVTVEHVKKQGPVASNETFASAAIFGNPLADEIRALGTDLTPEQARDAVRNAFTEAFGPSPTTIPLSAFVATAKKPATKQSDSNKEGKAKKKGFFARLFG